METNSPTVSLAERAHAIAASLIAELTRAGGASEVQVAGLLALHADELAGLARAATDEGRPALSLLRLGAEMGRELLADHEERRRVAAANGGIVGVRSGLNHLDEVLNGLEPGKLYILAAMPGGGKTTLGLQMAATVAQSGQVALYLSLENDARDLARKTACRLGGVSYAAALKGRLDAAAWTAAVAALDYLGGRLFLSTPRTTLPDLADLLDAVVEQSGQPVSLVVIDYLQAWVKRSAGADADVRQQIDRFTPALRALGERYNCAVLAISSQNRSGYLTGGMASLKESGDIEYNSDVTLTLARVAERTEKGATVAPPPLPPGAIAVTLTVEKNRQGLTGRPVLLALHGDRCMLTEV